MKVASIRSSSAATSGGQDEEGSARLPGPTPRDRREGFFVELHGLGRRRYGGRRRDPADAVGVDEVDLIRGRHDRQPSRPSRVPGPGSGQGGRRAGPWSPWAIRREEGRGGGPGGWPERITAPGRPRPSGHAGGLGPPGSGHRLDPPAWRHPPRTLGWTARSSRSWSTAARRPASRYPGCDRGGRAADHPGGPAGDARPVVGPVEDVQPIGLDLGLDPSRTEGARRRFAIMVRANRGRSSPTAASVGGPTCPAIRRRIDPAIWAAETKGDSWKPGEGTRAPP